MKRLDFIKVFYILTKIWKPVCIVENFHEILNFLEHVEQGKQNAMSIVSQNSTKLKFLLSYAWLTPNSLEKFIIYTDNIIRN